MRGGQYAYDAAEKPPPAPLYHADSQRQDVSASAPPLSDEQQQPRFAPQYPTMPPLAPSQYQQQQQQQQQQQRSSYANQALPDNYGHGSLRHQQPQPPPMYAQQQQGSFQYYAPGPHALSAQQQQQPLLPQYANQGYPPVNGVAFGPVIRRRPQRVPKRQFLKRMLKLVGFHAMNAVLGFAACSLLMGGVSSSFSLIPLCCFGIVVFRIVLYGVQVLAQLDVMLYNFISPPHEKVYLEKPLEPGVSGVVLAPSLECFSPLSILALLYFLSIKFVVAILSAVTAAMTVCPLVALISSACGVGKIDIQVGASKYSYHNDATAFLAATICITVIGAALMICAANVSKKATKFFCCEPFSNYVSLAPPGYQQQARDQQPSQQFTVTSYASYGSSA